MRKASSNRTLCSCLRTNTACRVQYRSSRFVIPETSTALTASTTDAGPTGTPAFLKVLAKYTMFSVMRLRGADKLMCLDRGQGLRAGFILADVVDHLPHLGTTHPFNVVLILQKDTSVSEAISGSSAISLSSDNAVAQSNVSATPGCLKRSSSARSL